MILTNVVFTPLSCFLFVCGIYYHLNLSLELAITSDLHLISDFRVSHLSETESSTAQTSLAFTKKPSNLFVDP